MSFKNSKQITIITISDIKLDKTLQALEISCKKLKPKDAIFFTSKNLTLNSIQKKYIRHVNINAINTLKDYSEFIIYELYKYIKTTHALIVQWDGYIWNEKKWDNKFLDYDYIGAPFIPRAFDYKYSRDKDGAFYVIGNGGFSLRSKKLLESATNFKLVDNKYITNFHEDGFYCVLHRKFLESKGYKWPEFKLAKNFAIETPLTFEDLKDLPFGFHGKKMLIIIIFIRYLKKFLNF